MVAQSGKQPTTLVEEMLEEFGGHYYLRNDIHLEARKEVEKSATEDPPEELGGYEVKSVETTDGVKLRFEDGWLLVRASGTEPLLRLYCEMDSPEKVDQILSEAEKYARNLAGE
jgi:phosphomannomutase